VYRQGRERVLLDVALRTATEMVDALTPLSQRCAYAGSLRRWREVFNTWPLDRLRAFLRKDR
jgi:DNA polymerase/3'-5' exonuclease PolX